MKNSVNDVYCPDCNDDRNTVVDFYMKPLAKCELWIFIFLFFPFAIYIYHSKEAWAYTHSCERCDCVLYKSDEK